MNITKTILDIQLRSARAAVHHLQTIDFGELAACAKAYGTPEDQAFIDAVAKALQTLPLSH